MFIVVVIVGFAVGAVFLALPAVADLDLAVGGVRAVADDEVIAQSLPAAGAVKGVEAFGAAGLSGAVMDDDALPAIGRLGRQPAGFPIERAGARARVALPNPDRRGREADENHEPKKCPKAGVCRRPMAGFAHP